LAPTEPEQSGHHPQVLRSRHGLLDGGGLPREADNLTHAPRLGADVDAGNVDLATIGSQQGGDRADEGGLAGAVGAEQGGDLTGVGDEVEAVEGAHLAEALGQAVRFDDGGWGNRSSLRVQWSLNDRAGA